MAGAAGSPILKMIALFLLLAGFPCCFGQTSTNVRPSLPLADSRPTYWGGTNAGLQLSLSVDPAKIQRGDKITLHLKTRNHTETNLLFDAGLPIVNESQIIVECPDGRRISHNIWLDEERELTIKPGESHLGDFTGDHWLDRMEYNPEKKGNTKFDTKRLQGVHKITWKLRNALSNTVEVRVE